MHIDKLKQLTPAERRVFDLVMLAKSNKQIAADLHISPRTVENHRARIARKLETSFTGFLYQVLAEAGIEL